MILHSMLKFACHVLEIDVLAAGNRVQKVKFGAVRFVRSRLTLLLSSFRRTTR